MELKHPHIKHPADRTRLVGDIHWQTQHFRCNASGEVMKRLAESHRQAMARGAQFFCKPATGEQQTDATGPFTLVPLWNSADHTLKVEVHKTHKHSSDDKPVAHITLPASLCRNMIEEYNGACNQGEAARNRLIRARELGGDTVRETLLHNRLEASDSLAKALFVAMAELEQSSSKRH